MQDRTVVTASTDLAARARQLAARASRGSMERKAAGCAAIALGESRTLAGARRVLDGLDAIGQADVKAAALAVLDQLTQEEPR